MVRTLARDFYEEIANILREYGQNGDRALARRRLQMLRVNFAELTLRQEALVNNIKRRL